MGIGRRLALDRAQAEALRFVEAGGFELAVVPDEAFGLPLLDEELAVLGTLERVGDDGLRRGTAEIGGIEERDGGAGRHGVHLWIGKLSHPR